MKNKSTKETVLAVLVIVFSAAVIALAALQLFGVWELEAVYIPMTGVVLLLQTIIHWKNDRTTAIVNLCAAVFVFLCTVAILVIPLFR